MTSMKTKSSAGTKGAPKSVLCVTWPALILTAFCDSWPSTRVSKRIDDYFRHLETAETLADR